MENATNVLTIMLRNIHSYFIQRRIKKEHVTATKLFDRTQSSNNKFEGSDNIYLHVHCYQSSSTSLPTAGSHISSIHSI